MPTRAPKIRPYTGDHLTLPKSGNWTVQFRVPEHLRGLPPFGNKAVFKKSLGTKDRRLALKLKDEFLQSIGFNEPAQERDRASTERTMNAPDFYFEHLNALDRSQGIESFITLSQEIAEQIRDVEQQGGSQRQVKRLEAQLAATQRAIDEEVTDGRSSDQPHPYQITLRTAVERYEKEAAQRGLPKKTVSKARTALNRFVAFVGQNPTMIRIRRPRVGAYWKAMRAEGKSKSVVSNDLAFLGAAFKQAVDEGFLPDNAANPFREHRLDGFAARARRSVYSPAQLSKLIVRLQEDKDLRAALYVGYYTGMRLAEVFTAKLRSEHDILVFSVAEQGGKTASATRVIPVHSGLKRALEQLGYWPEVGNAISWKTSSAQALGKRFGRVKDEVLKDLPPKQRETYTFHSLRHGFITMLSQNGFTELQIADLSGHAKSGSKTEAGRTYTGRQQLTNLVGMVESLPGLAGPTA